MDSASYANSRRFIEGKSPATFGAIRIEEFINYFDYNYSAPRKGEPFSIHTEVSVAPWNRQHRLVQIGLKAKTLGAEERPTSNLVFLIDVSGSMNRPNKLPLLKKAFSLLVNQLGEEDRVSIVVYASRQGLALPSTSGAQKQTILAALSQLGKAVHSWWAGIKLHMRKHVNTLLRVETMSIPQPTASLASSAAGLIELIKQERSGVF